MDIEKVCIKRNSADKKDDEKGVDWEMANETPNYSKCQWQIWAAAKEDGGNELWKVEQERRQGVVAGGIALWQRDGWGGVDK